MAQQLNVPTFCVITGGNRGIGREVAIQLAQKFDAGSRMCLVARDLTALEETARLVEDKSGQKVTVKCIPADLMSEEGAEHLNQSIFGAIGDAKAFKHGIMIHNAASVGLITINARDVDDVGYLQKFNMLNLSGPIAMISEFFKVFGHGKDSVRKTIVQTTSENATNPRPTLHIYSMVKAAREMFFRVMALEEPDVRVLSYDPGLVDTDMYKEASTTSKDDDLRSTLQGFTQAPFFLKPEQCAGALVKVIEEDTYESGSVVRCFDVLGMKVEWEIKK